MRNNAKQSWLSLRSRYLPVVWIAWGGISVSLYFYWFPLPQLNADTPYPALALTLWIGWVALMTGSLLLRRLKLQYRSSVEHLIFSGALGLALLGYIIFALGLAHILFSWLAYTVLIVLTILSAGEIRFCGRILRHTLLRPYRIAKLDVALGAILLGLLGLHLAGTLIPPIAFDAMVYHLAIPKLYILQHGIEYIPYNFFSNFPFLMEMLYTLGLLLRDAIVVNALNYLIHLFLLAGIYSCARTYFSHRIGLVSVMIFYTIPWVGLESFLPYIDLGQGLYAFLSVYALLNWMTRKHTAWLVVCGIMTGFAAGTKYQGLHNVVLIGVTLLGWLIWTVVLRKTDRTHQDAGKIFRNVIFAFGLPLLICGAPWYVKNLIWTGNPMYPFFFGGSDWTPTMLQRYMAYFAARPTSLSMALRQFFKVIYAIQMQPNTITIGPVFFVFLPLLLFLKRVPPLIAYLLGAGGLLTILWFNTSPQARMLIATLPLFSIVTAYTIEQLAAASRPQWLKYSSYGLLIMLLLANCYWEVIALQSGFEPFAVIAGLESKDDYLSRRAADLYPITQYANDVLPADAQIMYIGDSRGFYAERVFIANTAHDKTPIVEIAHESGTVDDVAKHLKALGTTHIIFNRREGSRLYQHYQYLHWKAPEDEQLFWEFYRTRLKQVKSINDSELLEIMY